jgi:hypothetical protein
MNTDPMSPPWTDANQAFLAAEISRIKGLLGMEVSEDPGRALLAAREMLEQPPAVDRLCELFGLSAFERDTLLLCAAVEMDSKLAARCGDAVGSPRRSCASFGLAMAALPEPHWSALTPWRPLRHWRLVEVEAGDGLTAARLRIDERILHYLAGVNGLDARLGTLVELCEPSDRAADEHRRAAASAAGALESAPGRAPVIHLCGDDAQGQENTAALAARQLGRSLHSLRADNAPPPGPELEQVAVLWQREALLLRGALLLSCGPEGLSPSMRSLAERLEGTLFVASREPVRMNRPFVRIDVNKPAPTEQKRLWEEALGAAAARCNGDLEALSGHFRLSARTIFSTGSLIAGDGDPNPGATLWNACRSLARPQLEDLAQRIVSKSGWDDLVLPEPQRQILRLMVSQVRHRMKVCETWGFSAKGQRGLGIAALFSGESGTGKTLAAEVLAHELALDLYRIDLSAVVSKYIGETEKNLSRIFDAAEEGGSVLLFDEADALFGKRGDVKDSHDRYANIEVGYLLQRMEAYQGLAILTTNLKSSLDRSFQRRLRFTVNFPFPDSLQREGIWSRVFPAATPTEGLDPRKLSQLNVAGGNIRNIALNAAFLAAESNGPVKMGHVLRAAALEAQKIERPLSEAETRGWV